MDQGTAVAILRDPSNGSRRSLASKLGVHHTYLNAIAAGKRPASQRILDGLAKLFPNTEVDSDPKKIPAIMPVKVKLRTYVPPPSQENDPEEMVLVLGDLQIGHKTKSYNVGVFHERLWRLRDSVLNIVHHHRMMRPINKLHIIKVGDDIQGEEIGHKVDLDSLEEVVLDQMWKTAIPEPAEFGLSLANEFEHVEFHGVPGNHGAIDKFHAKKTNWDNMINKSLELAFKLQPRILCSFEYDEFYQIVDVMGHKFFVFHGGEINSTYQGTPYYAVIRRVASWYVSLGPFYAAILGHYYHSFYIPHNRVGILGNGAFPTDDAWAIKKLGVASVPEQWVFGVHPKYGMTWRYPLNLAPDFLPGGKR